MPRYRHLPQCLGVYPNIVPTTVVMQLASMLTEMFLKVATLHDSHSMRRENLL